MLFYIKAKVEVKVRGISGAFGDTKSYLVRANNIQEAKHKFESRVRAEKQHMGPDDIIFTYIEIAPEI